MQYMSLESFFVAFSNGVMRLQGRICRQRVDCRQLEERQGGQGESSRLELVELSIHLRYRKRQEIFRQAEPWQGLQHV